MLLRVMFAGIIIIISVSCIYVLRPDLFRGETARKTENTFAVAAPSDPILQFRTERQQLRSLQITELDEMINSDSVSPEVKRLAEEEKLSVLKRAETEESIGGVLRARGFKGAAVCSEDDLLTVMIYSLQPTESEISVIMDTISSITETGPENIKIIPIN